MTDAIDPLPQAESAESLVTEFQARRERLDQRLVSLENLIADLRQDLQGDSQASLHRLAEAAHDMANGRVYQKVDIEAKGELGALVLSINQTLLNLQQLDASVKHQSTQVPELAAQLDAITADTETATQSVMNRLDTLMSAADGASRSLGEALKGLEARQAAQTAFQETLDHYLDRAQNGDNPLAVAQEILEYLFTDRMTSKLAPVELGPVKEEVQKISDEAFEILNELQFQDITRQKVEKVVLLLKQFQSGLSRLLAIFNFKVEGEPQSGEEVFEHRSVATQERIFEASLEADHSKNSVDDIVAQFRKQTGP
jgi:chemotaxis regulatin CheY-phosphate phosphatase CheZ